jgi:acetyl-CoA carboxylase carboxyltransferase component
MFKNIIKKYTGRHVIMQKDLTVGKSKITSLFDAGSFVEIGAYIKRGGDDSAYDGVVCGYGSIGEKLAFAFVQDSDRTHGAFDEIGAKKIEMLYDMAIKNGAAVIGVFDSAGAVVTDGSAALSAYGRFISSVARASGVVPQIAVLDGLCTGMALTVANMFDFTVKVSDKANLYLIPTSNDKTFACSVEAESEEKAYAAVRELVSILPQNNKDAASVECADSAARLVDINGLTGAKLVCELADGGKFFETDARNSGIVTGFAYFGGTLCGVVASNNECDAGKIGYIGAKKAAELISFCDRFGISVLTLVDSEGLCNCANPTSLAAVASAYANATTAKVTAVVGKAYGAAFTLLGSKSVGADLAVATESAIISVMSPESAVAFLMNDEISHDKSRSEVEAQWCEKYASAEKAAEKGDVDDIVGADTLRARICSALYMLSVKADGAPDRKYARTPV